MTSDRRRKEGFTAARIYAILGEEAKSAVDPWFVEMRALSRAAAALRRHTEALAETTAALAADPNKLSDVAALQSET
jgi:hypothetical protein